MSLRQFVVAEPPKRKANASAGQGSPKRPRPYKTFFNACFDGDLKAVQWYIEDGIDINQANEGGVTPLYIACWFGHLDVVNALLRFRSAEGQSTGGIDINQANKYGETPLFIACENAHLEVVNALLRFRSAEGQSRDGIDVNRADTKIGQTPLYEACFWGYLEVVKALLSTVGININQANKFGESPLYAACEEGREQVVNALLARPEIDVNQANNRGKTPFQVATAACKEALIRWRDRKMAEEIGRHRNLPEAIVRHGIHPFLNHDVKTKLEF